MTEIIVVNIHHSQYDVLIDRKTIFGNPFPEWKWGREECIRRFESYFWSRIERDPEWKAKVLAIRDKAQNGVVRIGCHCYPLDCHGRIYKEYLESYDAIERLKLVPQLEALWADINRLATEHGWYEPELQGEAIYRLALIDDDAAQDIVLKQINNADYDVLGEILNLIKGTN